MSEVKHTPGPWVTDNGGDAFYGVFGPDGGALAYLLDVAPGVQWQSAVLPMDPSMTMRDRFAIHEANATLMAAAPDLAEALRAAERQIDRYRESMIEARTLLDQHAEPLTVRAELQRTLMATPHVGYQCRAALEKAGYLETVAQMLGSRAQTERNAQ